jgi:hypothetical protein
MTDEQKEMTGSQATRKSPRHSLNHFWMPTLQMSGPRASPILPGSGQGEG